MQPGLGASRPAGDVDWIRVTNRSCAVALLIYALSWSPASGAEPETVAAPPPACVRRGDAVEAHYQVYERRLQRFYETLSARVKVDAPDLYPKLETAPPHEATYGWGLLPRLLPMPAPQPTPAVRPRAVSRWYSWPWTDQKIDTEMKKLDGYDADLERLPVLQDAERRAIYERLVREYPRLPEAQRNIDDHLRYNRLWQPGIVADRGGYDRRTRLHDAVLERQAVLDALQARDDAAFAKAIDGVSNLDHTRPREQLESELRNRERQLADEIHDVIDEIDPPAFLRITRPTPYSWVLRVPVYTDIEDPVFLDGFRNAIETIWRLRDGEDEYRVELIIHTISPEDLYRRRTGCKSSTEARCRPPHKGDRIDLAAHVALFPSNGVRLTTGATLTYALGGAIVLGPGEAGPHLLAHEFGHMLGFRDEYFRGYRDLGPDGFLVMEVVADPDDVMGNPEDGPVRRRQFERLVAAVGG